MRRILIVAGLVLSSSTGVCAPLTVDYWFQGEQYHLFFKPEQVQLVSTRGSLNIRRDKCSSPVIDKFRSELESGMASPRKGLGLRKDPLSAVLRVQGVTTRIPASSKYVQQLKNVPFHVVVLAQRVAKKCSEKHRKPASDSVVGDIDSLNEGKKDCADCGVATRPTEEKNPFQACIADICKSRAWNQKSQKDAARLREAANDPRFVAEILPIVKEADRLSKELDRKIYQRAAELLSRPKFSTEYDQKAANFYSAVASIPNEAYERNASGQIEVHTDKLRAQMPDRSEAEIQSIAEAGKLYASTLSTKSGLMVFNLENFSDVAGTFAATILVGSNFSSWKGRWEALPPDLKKSFPFHTIAMDMGGSLIGQQVFNLQYTAETSSELDDMASSVVVLEAIQKWNDQTKPVSPKAFHDLLKKSFGADTGGSLIKSTTEEKCAARFARIVSQYPDKEGRDAFRAKETQLVSDFLAKTAGTMSEQSQGVIRQKANSYWRFALPVDRDTKINAFKSNIQAASAAMKKGLQGLKGSATPQEVMAYALKGQDGDGGLCKDIVFIDDASGPINNFEVTQISPFMITEFPQTGLLLNHELGHQLVRGMEKLEISSHSRAKFAKIKKCLTSQHVQDGDKDRAVSFANEDLADFYGAISTPKDVEHPTCYLLEPSAESGNVSKLEINNPDEDDNHPSHLYRALHAYFIKNGNLPESCEAGLKANGQKIDFKDCRNN